MVSLSTTKLLSLQVVLCRAGAYTARQDAAHNSLLFRATSYEKAQTGLPHESKLDLSPTTQVPNSKSQLAIAPFFVQGSHKRLSHSHMTVVQ